MANVEDNCLTKMPKSHGTMFYHQFPLSASDADRHCENAHNARLAVLNTQEKFLDALLGIPPLPTQELPQLCGTSYYRIGLTRSNSKDNPMWITGVKYQRFNSSQSLRQDEERTSGESYAEIVWGSVDVLFSDPTVPAAFLCYKSIPDDGDNSQLSTVTEKSRNNTVTPSSSTTTVSLGAAANAGILAAFVVIAIVLAVLLVMLLIYIAKKRYLKKHENSAVATNPDPIISHHYISNDDNAYAAIGDGTAQLNYEKDECRPTSTNEGRIEDGTSGDVYYSAVPHMAEKQTFNSLDVYTQVNKPKKKDNVYREVEKTRDD